MAIAAGIQSLSELGETVGSHNLLIGGGAAAIVIAYLAVVAVWNRPDTRTLEAPSPRPEIAIHYKPHPTIGSIRLPALFWAVVAAALILLEAWDFRRGEFDLLMLAFLGLPLLAALAFRERSILRNRPAVAVYPQGLKLDSWRGETFVPWKDIEYVVTGLGEATWYRLNPDARLLIRRKDGREWRYSERDFGDEAQSRFDMICDLAQRHIQKPNTW